ncbi:hypothetical protein [Aromatoleum bremense]|nr:hypothetical protein [Aromatoleum bremense]QTQ34080.1 Uncharacterized protein pbN1_40970 [Aromatoleum bremense]
MSTAVDAGLDPLLRALSDGDCLDVAERLNRGCQCVSLDHERLRSELERDARDGALLSMIVSTRPHLFADSVAFVAAHHQARMAQIIAAVERVVALPGWEALALAYAPAAARQQTAAAGVFLGYDFHLGPEGPQLIEINTNAGGALLNVALARAQRACCAAVAPLEAAVAAGGPCDPEAAFIDMFRSEWRAMRGDRVLQTVVIVDREPQSQYLLPEFVLFQRLFERHGLAAFICDPAELEFADGRLWLGETVVDLVYNRLTDFALTEPESAALAQAWAAQATVITPHPRAHALYADKRNLALLSDDATLRAIGADADTRSVLAAGIPATRQVRPEDAEALWRGRRDLFFKPASGFGSRATYRGDKLTRRVFDEILAGDYIAQRLVPPGARRLSVGGVATDLKMDLRNYVYRGRVQLLVARLYRGQTTNFRTPGGGFAAVVALPCAQS